MIYYNTRKHKPIFIFGHRGAPKILYENSIDSILKSIELGADGIEVDIQITKDNNIILFHDDYIVSNNTHLCIIQEMNYKTIINLCLHNNIPKPALIDDLIDIIKNHTSTVFNI